MCESDLFEIANNAMAFSRVRWLGVIDRDDVFGEAFCRALELFRAGVVDPVKLGVEARRAADRVVKREARRQGRCESFREHEASDDADHWRLAWRVVDAQPDGSRERSICLALLDGESQTAVAGRLGISRAALWRSLRRAERNYLVDIKSCGQFLNPASPF